MKKIILAASTIGLIASAGLAHADTKKPMPLWLCSDYVGIDESYRPLALGFAEALNRKGKPEAEVLDVEGITKVQPELLTYCKENPKIALRDALIQTWGKTKK